MTTADELDQDTMFMAADGSMMCERHPGQEWPHNDCAGPGMPWVLEGKSLIQRVINKQFKDEIAAIHNSATMIMAHAREACERLNAIEFPATTTETASGDRSLLRWQAIEPYLQHKSSCASHWCATCLSEWGRMNHAVRRGIHTQAACDCGLADVLKPLPAPPGVEGQ